MLTKSFLKGRLRQDLSEAERNRIESAVAETVAVPPRTVLNVKIPHLPLEHIRGIQLTRLGHRARAAAPVKVVNPRGKEGYWIAVAGDAEDGGPGTDFHAVMQGYVSITPLQLDRTFQDGFDSLQPWLEGLL